MAGPSAWFLDAGERGNAHTEIDRRHGGVAWSEGNQCSLPLHGRDYYHCLERALAGTESGDSVHFTDWRGDEDELLGRPGAAVGATLAALARRGVHVRGLLWASHPDQGHFSQRENMAFSELVNQSGGEVRVDNRVRRAGSHHQKLVVVRHPEAPHTDVAFVGGIDLGHGRNDDPTHRGDPQSIEIDPRYGTVPAWHDLQMEVRGPVVGDLALTFRERWTDPIRLDHGAWSHVLSRAAHAPRTVSPLPDHLPDPPPAGPHLVQVLRTYPAKRPGYTFAPTGERSIARSYVKAFARARSLIYLEDQYLWAEDAAKALAAALVANRDLRLVIVVPRYPDENGVLSGPASRIGQEKVLRILYDAGGDRVAAYDLERADGQPIYVHAKICVVDDVWMIVGSDNVNRRSWSHDSELACAVIDTTRDEREPTDPGGLGDGARVLARQSRIHLWAEHTDTAEGELPLDAVEGFDALRASAARLDAWHDGGQRGERPPGRLRAHRPEPVPWWARAPAHALYRLVVDPDGRPWTMRARGRY